jgi:hypothetical protein
METVETNIGRKRAAEIVADRMAVCSGETMADAVDIAGGNARYWHDIADKGHGETYCHALEMYDWNIDVAVAIRSRIAPCGGCRR